MDIQRHLVALNQLGSELQHPTQASPPSTNPKLPHVPCLPLPPAPQAASDTKFADYQPKVAFFFPGQGAQTVGMGKEVAEAVPAARQLFDRASDILGYDLLAVCAEGGWAGGCGGRGRLCVLGLRTDGVLAGRAAAAPCLQDVSIAAAANASIAPPALHHPSD